MSTHWNYRILATYGAPYKGDSPYYTIVECFYSDKGEILPKSWSANSSTPFGDSVEELKGDLEMMLLAFNKPVLVEEFDGDGDAVRLVEDK